MFRYILKRLLYLIPVLLGVSFIVFSLLYLTPGDMARNALGPSASEAAVKALRIEMGLEDPFLVQYGRYLKNVIFHFDLGYSYITRSNVTPEIMSRAGATLKLAATAITFAVVVGVPVGIQSLIM